MQCRGSVTNTEVIWDPRTSRRNFWPSHSVRCRFRVLCRWNRWLGWYQNFWRNLNHLVFSMSQIGGRVYASSPVAGCLRLFHYAILCERKVDVLKNLVGCSDTPLLVKIFESSHNDATCAMRVRACRRTVLRLLRWFDLRTFTTHDPRVPFSQRPSRFERRSQENFASRRCGYMITSYLRSTNKGRQNIKCREGMVS